MDRCFLDRADAGRQLGLALKGYAKAADTLVIGIPRGGVVTAFEVALALALPLDIFIVRKLGVPSNFGPAWYFCNVVTALA